MKEKEIIKNAIHLEVPKAEYIIEKFNNKENECLQRRNYRKKTKKCYYRYGKLIFITSFIFIFLTVGTVYAFSPDFQSLLAKKLKLDNEEISSLEISYSNNDITMSAVSSRVVSNTVIIMITFTKDNGKIFENSMNPVVEKLICENKKIDNYMVDTSLSDNKKILYCYFVWNSDSIDHDKTIYLSVNRLLCNESQLNGTKYKDNTIDGKWSLSFSVDNNSDNIISGDNLDLSKTIYMSGKELQINSVSIADLQVIVNTSILQDFGKKEDLLSSINTDSGMYYGVYVTIIYEDGSTSGKMDCRLDKDGNIIAFSLNPLTDKQISEVHIKDVVIPIE